MRNNVNEQAPGIFYFRVGSLQKKKGNINPNLFQICNNLIEGKT